MIDFSIQTQPDDETCGPTCLHAIYEHYGLDFSLPDVISHVPRSRSGGTLAAYLGKDALIKGFEATIYINNLDLFDPTWFSVHGDIPGDVLIAKLAAQKQYKKSAGIIESSDAYSEFIEAGGEVRFQTLTINLLKEFFKLKLPILTGLSATYLYRSARERFTEDGTSFYDDIRGTPCGHFVVLCGYDEHHRHVIVADPHRENPLSHDNYYKVSSHRLINAILLGVLTYDANMLIIKPKGI